LVPLDLYTDPIDGRENRLVYSEKLLVTPFSFINAKLLQTLPNQPTPPPCYFKYAELIERGPMNKEAMLESNDLSGKNGLISTD
jgi:hypothetical protein